MPSTASAKRSLFKKQVGQGELDVRKQVKAARESKKRGALVKRINQTDISKPYEILGLGENASKDAMVKKKEISWSG